MAKGPTDMINAGRAWAIGIDLVAYVIAGGLIGFAIDWFAHTSPIFLLVFAGFGLASGMLRFIREALQLNREMSRKSRSDADRDSTPSE